MSRAFGLIVYLEKGSSSSSRTRYGFERICVSFDSWGESETSRQGAAILPIGERVEGIYG